MIVVDTNLLLYAYDPHSTWHEASRRWLEAALDSHDHIGLPWVCVCAFLRITTDSRARTQPAALEDVVNIIESWRERSNVVMLDPGARHWSVLKQLLSAGQVRGPLVTDAHIAALVIEHGGTLATNDRDFSRFPGLNVIYPLAGSSNVNCIARPRTT